MLCATGTAARVNVTYDPASSTRITPPAPAVVQEKLPTEKERDKKLYVDVNLANSAAQGSLHALYDHRSVTWSVIGGWVREVYFKFKFYSYKNVHVSWSMGDNLCVVKLIRE